MNNAWNEKEIKYIKDNYNSYSVRELANSLKRSYESVEHKIRALGLIKKSAASSIQNEIELPSKKDSKNLDKLIIQTLKDELSNIKPYIASKQSKVDIKGDTLVIQLTDLHAGKIVKNQEGELIYNEVIFRNRINRLCEQTLKLLDNNISKGVPINDVVIISCGDLANGEGIYLTQAYEQEIAPPKQVMLVVDVITKLIVSLLERKLSIKFYGVRGNHGRTGKDTDVTSNWDLMIYMILDFWSKFVLKNPKLEIKYTETEYLKFEIRGHGFLIRHIAPEQVDSPAGRVKINEWARRHLVEAIVYGHYHHSAVSDCDNVRVIRGGSTVGGDSLSDSMAKHSEPIQVVFGVNEQRVTTFIYFVDLGEKKIK
jgi:predicted phosphodiesterase